MTYKVQLTYFRQTGKFLTTVDTTSDETDLPKIWDGIDNLRRLGSLPGLRQGSGRDLFVLIEVPGHQPHIVMPPFVDEDDMTPPRIQTGEMVPLVRVALAEIPRTTTRDVVKPPVIDEEITPVDVPLPKSPGDDPR